jgi:preprotein translocase subunit SecD/preprotein translocase subunit SecF
MFYRPAMRFVPDGTRFIFMKARWFGLAGSFLLSSISIGLFFYPGLKLGIDFKGGIVMEAQTPAPADIPALRAAFAQAHIATAGLQSFGGPKDLLIRLDAQPTPAGNQAMQASVRATLEKTQPGAKIVRTDVVGASVSKEMFTNGLLALGISLAMIMAYIWFRFEWQFAVGAVVTLLLDVTKTVGFLVVTGIQFDLVMVAAILTIIGYSTNDKVVVYDRVRENLRKYKSMPLRDLIDLSINETLNRTLGTSSTVFLASLPLALFGGETLSGFAWAMLFGIAIGTVSSIMIAAPILLLLGEHRLRRDVTTPPGKAPAPAGAD